MTVENEEAQKAVLFSRTHTPQGEESCCCRHHTIVVNTAPLPTPDYRQASPSTPELQPPNPRLPPDKSLYQVITAPRDQHYFFIIKVA
ncbi:hypothetical protein E2C01_028198 [Portunus trituberculatus]|uniref:Uncharacterized protein n=1 Tax=Portunus trituberculatus TaxID=210409 RepID=A0A5B7ENE8_PORTR|nr:hypothetical protein [Portunus trituberculatus]